MRERAAFEKMQSNASGYGKNAGNESKHDGARCDVSRLDDLKRDEAKTESLGDQTPEVERTPEDMVGKINPREPELIQELRHSLGQLAVWRQIRSSRQMVRL